MSSEAARRRSLHEGGFTLVALIVTLVVLNVAVATALQLWSKVAQREKEEELIFRGLQYAEAIRVFQARFNRPPNSLEELLEVRPRAIRQLWEDPLSETGAWEPILAGSGSDVTQLGSGEQAEESSGEALARAFDTTSQTGRAAQRRQQQSQGFAASAAESQIGPIEGVRPTAAGKAARNFLGWTDYRSWEFRSSMLVDPRVTPEGVPLTPRIDPSTLGRPFPSRLSATPGSAPHPEVGEEDSLFERPRNERGGG